MTTTSDNSFSMILLADHIPGPKQGHQKKTIEVLILEDDGYQSLGIFTGKDTLPSRVVPGITDVAVEQFFFTGRPFPAS
jgi:hypothetical protein